MLIWWRRRESNPRPQALRLRLYMLIPPLVVGGRYPAGRENDRLVSLSFNGSTRNKPYRDPAQVDARSRKRRRLTGRRWRVLGRQGEVVVVSN